MQKATTDSNFFGKAVKQLDELLAIRVILASK